MSRTFYQSTQGYIEHGWMFEDGPGGEPVIIGTWVDDEPEGIRPADKYEPVRVSRRVGPWVASENLTPVAAPSVPVVPETGTDQP